MKQVQYCVRGRRRGRWHIIRGGHQEPGWRTALLLLACGESMWSDDADVRDAELDEGTCKKCMNSRYLKETRHA